MLYYIDILIPFKTVLYEDDEIVIDSNLYNGCNMLSIADVSSIKRWS